MRHLVDTDWVVDYLTGQKPAGDLFATLLQGGVAISIISLSEIYEGIYGSRDPKLAEAAFRLFLREVPVLGISRAIAKRNGQIRMELRRHRHQIAHRALDLLIAATALEHDLILVTRNLIDYTDVPGLKIHKAEHQTT
ncbi:MAG: type II toxin-antitoxin system VapC family toxin [Chloroflexi bacterium]|nr:type II toxin-antitoxin system VapC family toxin [Chloroflexota bacterium]